MPQRDRIHLFIPGPAGAAPEVLEALGAPLRPHYGADFVADYNLCRERLRRVFRTTNDLYLIVGPGTGALDAAMASALPDGAHVLVATNGLFGARLAEMARAHRAQVEVMEFGVREPIDADRVVERLRREPRLSAVAWVHHETATGVLNPVEPIARAGRELGVLSIIDAISSLGGTELDVDGWGVDLCVGVPNKVLAAGPGLAPISVSPEAWAAIDNNPDTRGWYYDLRTWRTYDNAWKGWHPYPTTVPSGVLDALNVSLEQLLSEGLECRIERTRQTARRVREALRGMGFSMFVSDAHASPITTAVHAHPDLPVPALLDALREQYGIYISGGLGELATKIFRIGHMGTATEASENDLLLAAFEEILTARRVASQPGMALQE